MSKRILTIQDNLEKKAEKRLEADLLKIRNYLHTNVTEGGSILELLDSFEISAIEKNSSRVRFKDFFWHLTSEGFVTLKKKMLKEYIEEEVKRFDALLGELKGRVEELEDYQQ